MAQKRAPGGGRKPVGEFKGKTATLTTRITPQLRTALERRANKNRRSLSQEIERCLRDAVWQDRAEPHIAGLAHAITLLSQAIERATQKRWLEDPFTGEAVHHGIKTLLLHFGPQGTPLVPSSVQTASARMPTQLADSYRTPTGLGEMETFNLITQIETTPKPHNKSSPKIHYPDEWYTYWQIRGDIGATSAAKRNVSSKENSQ
jgi:hypothetical protein